jgi:HD superfamily phosphohydrolase
VNGRLADNPSSKYWRETGEFHLKQGFLEDYHTRKSSAAVRLSSVQKWFSDGISDWARKWTLPQDLCHRVGKKTAESHQSSDEEHTAEGKCDSYHSNGSPEENNRIESEEEEITTTMTSKKNYFKVVSEKSNIQNEMEHTAANGQKKQAVEVNKNSKWEGGEAIPKGTVCLLKLSDEKNNVGVKDLLVVITSLHNYKQSGHVR